MNTDCQADRPPPSTNTEVMKELAIRLAELAGEGIEPEDFIIAEPTDGYLDELRQEIQSIEDGHTSQWIADIRRQK